MPNRLNLATRLGRAQDAYLRCHFAGCDLGNGFARRMQWFDRRDRVEAWVRKQTPMSEEERVIYDCFERTARPQVSEARPTPEALATVDFKASENAYRVQRGEGYMNSLGNFRRY